jgi:hypothetical protein
MLSPVSADRRFLAASIENQKRADDSRLTNADRMRTIRQVGAAMFAFNFDKSLVFRTFFGAPSETRTPDPLIKSQLLYQLS